jgi:hypothetical protein
LTTTFWTPVDQSRSILSMPACAPDFQSVPPSLSAAVVAAAAARPAVQIAADFLIQFFKNPRDVMRTGVFYLAKSVV